MAKTNVATTTDQEATVWVGVRLPKDIHKKISKIVFDTKQDDKKEPTSIEKEIINFCRAGLRSRRK